jgi:tetratricopeptide (TPR) repeat protein
MTLKKSADNKRRLVIPRCAISIRDFLDTIAVPIVATFTLVISCSNKVCALQADDDCYNAIMRGRQYVTKNDIANALLSFRTAQKFQPSDARPYFWIGYCLERTGDANGALKAYADCLESSKQHGLDSAELRIDLGNTLCKLNYFKEAIYDYRRALVIDPSLTVAHLCLARAYIETKDWANAMHELDFCRTHSLAVPEIGYLRTLALIGQGARAEALNQIQIFTNSQQRTLKNEALLQKAQALESELKR